MASGRAVEKMVATKTRARRGIVLSGGRNTRLYPATLAAPKSLLPVYDKPLIYYSLSALMLAGIREILIIATPNFLPMHKRLLGDGSRFGLRLEYAAQKKARGIADAFLLGAGFIDGAPSALALADNIFYGSNITAHLRAANAQKKGATVFAYPVPQPQRFGVVSFNKRGRVLSLEEKPQKPKSNFAVPGCYFYDERVCDIAKTLAPSARGELEITDLNNIYLRQNALKARQLGRGAAWFDAGTPDSLAEAGNFVRAIQKQQGLMIACLEEIAWRNGWINSAQLQERGEEMPNTEYGDYLRRLAEGKA